MKKINLSSERIKPVIISVLIIVCVITMKVFGIYDYISMDNIENLQTWIKSFEPLGPIVYIFIFIVGCLLFLPAPPLVILAGLVFGPLMGTLWTALAAIIADATAFLVARYAARDMIAKWANENKSFKRIDEGVKKEGWRILMITRLIPVFPYMIQSYAYGLTNIQFSSYILVSWICTIPGIIAFTFMGGAIGSDGSAMKIFMYLAIGAIVFMGISLIPRYVVKKKGINMYELE
ncbi:TVP38/TMEM64 family protein [Anaeromicrobium sediminis]|uniref:TVP38/TMEM64 family membrane protein n=1 Tax=Anaeromicrobium sediminis TaxID=1478221 RepID=A0A267MHR5_9FIRM|nr:TVP38/TMEM64 family protein [Anaeromicrobium sediminis]PAB58343.1 hypothetical protein CCE28_15505 [Anaeromicrobium sediminis]